MKKFDHRPVFVEIKKGNNTNAFIQQLHKRNVKIKKMAHTDTGLKFEIARKDLSILREIRKKYRVKIKIHYVENSNILQKTGWTFIGLLLLIMIPIICGQFVWKVEVEAETPELRLQVEKVVNEELELNKPLLKRKMLSDFDIRQKIMEEIRDLSWVHIIKTGSNIKIIPQKAPINNLKSSTKTQLNDLVASKSGVITHFNIKKGERLVSINSTVHKGDKLVSGVLSSDDKNFVIGAEGEVYADYWLETDFTIPINVQYISSTGTEWVFHFKKEQKEQGQYFQKVNLPKWFGKFVEIKKIQNYTLITEELSEKQVESLILPLLHEKILKSLPPKTVIKKENILHVTFDDDKVKGKVLFLVNENIAVPVPIVQDENSAENFKEND